MASWDKYTERLTARQRRVAAEKEEGRIAEPEGALPGLPQQWSKDAPSEEDWISRSNKPATSSTPAPQSTSHSLVMSPGAPTMRAPQHAVSTLSLPASQSSTPAAELPRARQPLVLPAYCAEEEEEEEEEEEALPELPQKWGGDAGMRLDRKDEHPRWVEEREPLEGTPASLSSMQMQASQQQGADQQQGAAEVLRELCGILPITSKTSLSSASSMTMMKSLRPGVDDQRALKKLAAATLSCLRNLKPRDGNNRAVVQARLQEVGEWAVPGSTMQLFGSTACELHAHGADLDLTLQTQGPPPSYAEQQALVRH